MQQWVLNLDVGFLKAPFTLIFYLLSKTILLSGQNIGLDLDDLVGQAERIVRNDFKEIGLRCKGLALTLFNYAHISQRYGLPISDRAFQKLVQHYNIENINIRNSDLHMLENILSRYVTRLPITVPGIDDEFFAHFHDPILTEMLTLEQDNIWQFSDEDVFEILTTLFKKDERGFAVDLFVQLEASNKVITEHISNQILASESFLCPSYLHLVYLNCLVFAFYENFRVIEDEALDSHLIQIINAFHQQELGTEEITAFFESLIDRGCSMNIILELYNDDGYYADRMIRT